MIRVENLTREYRDLRRGTVLAVDHINLDVKAGEIFGLLGPNGAGKTTTMRILWTVQSARCANPSTGSEPLITRIIETRGTIGLSRLVCLANSIDMVGGSFKLKGTAVESGAFHLWRVRSNRSNKGQRHGHRQEAGQEA